MAWEYSANRDIVKLWDKLGDCHDNMFRDIVQNNSVNDMMIY